MIIFGWNFTTNQSFGVLMTQKCSLCDKVTKWELCKRRTWFTLFFIPIIPYNTDYCLVCSHCNGYISLTVLDFEKHLALIESTSLEERDKMGNSMFKNPDNIEFVLIPPDGSEEIYCQKNKMVKIKNLAYEYRQNWETPLAEDFCKIRYFLAKYDGSMFNELLFERDGKELTLGDLEIKDGDNIYIIKEHNYSNLFLIQLSIINEEEKEMPLIEIFDNEGTQINSFIVDWYSWKQFENENTIVSHIYVLVGNGVFLIKTENFKIIE